MTTDLNSIQGAPLANCFYFLPTQEIGTMCLVSKGWMNAASIQELWNCILENEFQTTIPLKIGETKALYKRIRCLPKELIDALGGIQNYLELPKNEVPNATSLSKWEFTNDDGSLRQLQLTVPFETRVNDMIEELFDHRHLP